MKTLLSDSPNLFSFLASYELLVRNIHGGGFLFVSNVELCDDQVDLLDFIDWSGVECLNQSTSHSLANALKQVIFLISGFSAFHYEHKLSALICIVVLSFCEILSKTITLNNQDRIFLFVIVVVGLRCIYFFSCNRGCWNIIVIILSMLQNLYLIFDTKCFVGLGVGNGWFIDVTVTLFKWRTI